jgi:integrase
MPVPRIMSWEPRGRRWWKSVKGFPRFVVSCRQLSKFFNEKVPETEEGSRQWANQWWRLKEAEIDRTPLRDTPLVEIDGVMLSVEDSARLIGPLLAATIVDKYADQPMPDALKEMILGKDRLADIHRKVDALFTRPEPDTMIRAQVEKYLALQLSRQRSREISASEYDLVRRSLEAFAEWAAGGIEGINADLWEGWYRHLLAWDGSVEYKRKRLRYARSFITWMAEKGLATVPPNLNSRRYRFKGGVRRVETIDIEVVKTMVAEAPGQLHLHLLLMLNCGMTQIDISELRQREVDWVHGRIIRKRSKTDHFDDVPEVDYVLWEETWELLLKFRQPEGDRVLLTESGKTWVRDSIDQTGKRHKVDVIASNYAHLKRRLKVAEPLKRLRKTSSSMLGEHRVYGRFAQHFLGQSPRTVADRHYVKPSRELFDEAVRWLGTQYGLTPR